MGSRGELSCAVEAYTNDSCCCVRAGGEARLEVEMKQGGRQTKRLAPFSKLLSRPGPTVEATSYCVSAAYLCNYVSMYPRIHVPRYPRISCSPCIPCIPPGACIYYGTCILYLPILGYPSSICLSTCILNKVPASSTCLGFARVYCDIGSSE